MNDIPPITPEQFEQLNHFFAEGNASREAVDRDTYIELLKDTPGLDPVLAVADGQPDAIPEEGWLVNAYVAPGYGGVVNLYRYPKDSFSVSSVSDTREKYGQVSVRFALKGYGSHVVAYENPTYPYKDWEPFNRMTQSSYTGHAFSSTEITALSNGGRLLNQAIPMAVHGGSLSASMNWDDWDNEVRRKYSVDMNINRVVRDPEQVAGVLLHLTAGMGLNDQDAQTFIVAVGKKLTHE